MPSAALLDNSSMLCHKCMSPHCLGPRQYKFFRHFHPCYFKYFPGSKYMIDIHCSLPKRKHVIDFFSSIPTFCCIYISAFIFANSFLSCFWHLISTLFFLVLFIENCSIYKKYDRQEALN